LGSYFNLQPGRALARKYEVVSLLGAGWEGEVYKIRERTTDIERAAKLFYPERNVRNKAANLYARKLHKLRDSPVVIQYHFQDNITIRGVPVTVLISEYVEGELLESYIRRMPGRRLPLFQGIHLLHALASGIESIHIAGEYHGDLHSENVMIRGLGLSYELKFLDFFHYGKTSRENRDDDICDAIRIFYDAIGGSRHYRKHPQQIKKICCGLKRSLILKKFRSASALRSYLEAQRWT
jgi:serine/threonine protein kinase